MSDYVSLFKRLTRLLITEGNAFGQDLIAPFLNKFLIRTSDGYLLEL